MIEIALEWRLETGESRELRCTFVIESIANIEDVFYEYASLAALHVVRTFSAFSSTRMSVVRQRHTCSRLGETIVKVHVVLLI